MVTRLKQPHVSTSSTDSSSEAFYTLSGDKDTTERRLAKPKSNSGTSLVSQRSMQPSFTTPLLRTNGLRRDTSNDTLADSSANDADDDSTPPQSSVNDVSREKSSSSLKDIWATVPRPTLRAHYKLSNPLGPRWYRNYHLIPPSHLKPSMRPPTFFSPSFPPIGTASPDHYDDEELSGSPSHSPLPTPDSSQTRVQDVSKPRSRKTSQTAPDAIDMLDLSDPWGQNWHHKSPYEFGQTIIAASLDTTDLPNRTRRASFSVSHARQMSVAPSPLSQSTSAVNLPSLQPEIKHPRKLSKRKTTNVTTIFQNSPPQADRKPSSVPATPIDAPVASTSDTLPKRMSIAPAGPFMTPSPTPKREKRASLLNRLVKKFSTLKRGSEPILGGVEGWNYESTTATIGRRQSSSVAANTLAFPEKPSVKADSSGYRPDEDKPVRPQQEDDRASLSSLEIPYSIMGKLTVVNPDPSEEENELVVAEKPAQTSPPDLDKESSPVSEEEPFSSEPPEPVSDDSLPSPTNPESDMSLDKPLPPRLGTPRFSGLVISEFTVSTPQVTEQPLPPLPPKDVAPEEPPPECEVTPPPSPALPAEPPELPQEPIDDPFHIVNSISLDHTAHEPPPPVPTPDGLKRKASPPKEVPQKPVLERRLTQSPATSSTAQRDSPPTRQPSNRNAAPPEVTPAIERQIGSLRSTNGQVSLSTRELLAEFKSPPSRTGSRSNSRPETRSVPAPAQAPPQFLVPFPTTIEGNRPLHAESPSSTSSVLANPPTPYDHRLSIDVSDMSLNPPTVPPKSVRHHSPPPPKAPATAVRTETFKLVKSSSGNVYASSQTILAQGQQWEVVETVENTRKDKSLRMKAKERDLEREREKEREREVEREREKERPRAREKELEREKQRAREREMELQKEKAREERERREAERVRRELEIQREKERAKQKERREAERLQRELELQREWERAREWERREAEREKERLREREKEKERERARLREKEKESERERQREKERESERERQREKEREKEKQREKDREKERERERRKERERREREREKEKERRREREKEKEREREEKERWEREREKERRVRERSHEEVIYRERRSGHYDRKSRDYDRREYERRSRDYEPRTDSSEHRSRDDGRPRESDRKATGYDHREPRHEKSSSRQYDDSRPHDDRRQSRQHDERHHDHRSPRHPAEMSSTSYIQHQPEPAVQAMPIPEPQPVRLERVPSLSARPLSQLPSADEMNAVRAKEQWEMERLWKGRSLYGLEPNGTANHIIHGHSSNSSMSDDIPEIDPASPAPQIHGSSHTAYLVRSPFHDSRPQIYHSMPTAPPPIYFHSPASIPSIPDCLSSYEPYENLRFYPGPAQVAETLPLPSFPLNSNNPLPEPPRESSYKPAPLSSSSLTPSKRRSTEYWTFNGITTAH